ncbi:MAG: hypothetical protein HY060_03595, partial [Proteobacteria bacterium]|nr:hypothetical protein [Pseudomonadota bacterium]
GAAVRRLVPNARAVDDVGPGFFAALVAHHIEPARPAWFLLNAHGAGDTYLVGALARQFRRHHGAAAPRLAMVVKEAHLPIAQMFGDAIDDIYVAPDDYLRRARAHQARHGLRPTFGPQQGMLAHPACLTDAPIEQLALIGGVSRMHLFGTVLRLPLPPAPDLPTIQPEWRETALREAERLGIVPGRSVVLVPDADTWPALGDAFWERLAARLTGLGWTVLTNLAGSVGGGRRTKPFGDSVGLDVPIGVFLPLVECAGWVIGSLCGLMSLMVSARTDCKKTVVGRSPEAGSAFTVDGIALANAYPYGLQRTFDGADYDVEYVDARAELAIETLVEEIAQGRNAGFNYRASREPATRMRIDVAPGDVVDKMTILEVKLEKLPADKRVTILGELAWVRHALVATYGPLTGELKAAADRLRDLNRGAFDVNEVVYQDFDDPAFLKQAAAGEIAGIEERVAACITNFLRGVGFNRERILVKNRINALLNCDWMERRSFVDRG